jgi:NADPH:quinone reductase-like Zn-dependent oxidoreductase
MHDALMTNGRLKKGESVLVQGASSGVGLMALKIAKLMGAGLVIGTSTNEARRAAQGVRRRSRARFAFDGLGRGGAESDRRQGRRSHHRSDFCWRLWNPANSAGRSTAYPFAEADTAFAHIRANAHFGKIVLSL